jgi:hypothetical protein
VPSVRPEEPPPGTWGELYPSSIAGRSIPLPGDPIAEALGRTRRIASALAALGVEPPPRLLSAPEIAELEWSSLDPIGAQLAPRAFTDSPRSLQQIEEVTT